MEKIEEKSELIGFLNSYFPSELFIWNESAKAYSTNNMNFIDKMYEGEGIYNRLYISVNYEKMGYKGKILIIHLDDNFLFFTID